MIETKEVKVKDKDHLIRETFSKGIINTDVSCYEKSKRIRQEFTKRQRDELRNVSKRDKYY